MIRMTKERWMIASTAFNAMLAGAKMLWSVYSGSTLVVADAVHSLGDVIGAFFIYLAIRFARRRSPRFPYGMNKLEDVAALAGGIVVALAGYEIVRRVFFEQGVSPPKNPGETILFMTAILAATMVFYVFERKAARKLNSPGVEADAANWLGDMAANGVVIAGMLGLLLGLPYVQEIAVLIITLFVFHSAYAIMKHSVLSLLDASAPPEVVAAVRDALLAFPMVKAAPSLKVTPAGSVYFVTATITIDEKSLKEAHQWVDTISDKVKATVPNVEEVVIHYEPVRKGFIRHAALLNADRQTLTTEFGKAVWILLVDRDAKGRTLRKQYVKNPYASAEKGRGIRLTAFLIDQDIDRLVTPESFDTSGPPAELLTDVGVSFEPADALPGLLSE